MFGIVLYSIEFWAAVQFSLFLDEIWPIIEIGRHKCYGSFVNASEIDGQP